MVPTAMKLQLRAEIKSKLRTLAAGEVAHESRAVCERFLSSDVYRSCSALSVFLSMPTEVQTEEIIKDAIRLQKKVFIPKITGPNSPDMVIFNIVH